MTHECAYNTRLSAFHDGELDAAASRELEQHLQTCSGCAGQLDEIRGMSSLFGSFQSEPITEDELARVHEAVDNVDVPMRMDRTSPLRIAGFLTAAAASILVVSAAWLREMPPAGPVRTIVRTEPSESSHWEFIATNLTADPGPIGQNDTGLATGSLGTPEEWMLRQLQN